jgi:hypothetical protein
MTELYVSCPPLQHCPVCGDRLIHQKNRKGNESSSAYGQYIHENYGNDFDFMDLDGVIWKRTFKILRIIEHKPLGQMVKNSQRRILPIFSRFIALGVSAGFLHPQSGVFVILEAESLVGGQCLIIKVTKTNITFGCEVTKEIRRALETGLPIDEEAWKELEGEPCQPDVWPL